MKINKLFKLVLIMLMTICIIQFVPNKVEAATKLNLKVSYIYSAKKDRVTVQIKSNMKFKDTKPTWTLSKDKKTYSKKFYTNQTYKTTFTAQNGKTKTLTIKVNQIKGPQITVSYKYDSTKNTVKVTVKSNKEFKDTKPTWNLSKDKLTYTKTFKNNQTYTTTFYDKYGNKKKVKLTINQIDKTGPVITLTYKYNSENNTVLLTAKSNEELKDTKSNWNLSKDKLTYTKTFKNNQTYTTSFYDKYGNKTNKTIKITQVDDVGPKLSIEYKYSDDKNQVLVMLIANEELSDTLTSDGWELSEDKKVYTKTLARNGTYTALVKDIWGNETNKTIKMTELIYKGIDVSSWQGRINWVEVKETGIDYVILRLGWIGNKENHTLDSYFKENYEACTRLGIPVGVYVYSYCESEETVESGAKWVIEQLKGKKLKYPVYIDMEDNQIEGLDKEKLTSISKTFCEKLKDAGYNKVGVYANKNWLTNKLDASQLSEYEIWLAHYTSSTDYSGKYGMWQYTSSGTVNGIIGNVDMNYCYKNY